MDRAKAAGFVKRTMIWEQKGRQLLQSKENTGVVPSRKGTMPVAGLFRESLETRYVCYFRGRTESFIALPTRNFSVVFAGI